MDGRNERLAEAISAASGSPFRLRSAQSVAGGSINSALRLDGETNSYFVKLNRADRLDMFVAEAEGLRELLRPGVVRVPVPLCWGELENQAYLVLEYLPMGRAAGHSLELLGGGLAALHHQTWDWYGWRRDNTIGSTPQINDPTEEWIEFWRRHRLGYQLQLAAQRGLGPAVLRTGEHLLAELEVFFSGYRPAPSLLHGDLWSGNFGATRDGEPVLFDPAVYYGDRETDLAMSELFGGFGPAFYEAYNAAWPLDPGYAVRRDLYNLYHLLNHFNLFGGGYGAQSAAAIERLLREIR